MNQKTKSCTWNKSWKSTGFPVLTIHTIPLTIEKMKSSVTWHCQTNGSLRNWRKNILVKIALERTTIKSFVHDDVNLYKSCSSALAVRYVRDGSCIRDEWEYSRCIEYWRMDENPWTTEMVTFPWRDNLIVVPLCVWMAGNQKGVSKIDFDVILFGSCLSGCQHHLDVSLNQRVYAHNISRFWLNGSR